MSLLKKAAKIAGKIAKKAAPVASIVPGPLGAAGRLVTGVATAGAAISGARAIAGLGGSLGKTLPALPRVIPGVGKAVGKAVGAAATGYAIYDAAGNFLGTRKAKARRINPMNHRALTRAIRRVCAAKQISKKIEKLTGGGGGRRRVACAPHKSKRC